MQTKRINTSQSWRRSRRGMVKNSKCLKRNRFQPPDKALYVLTYVMCMVVAVQACICVSWSCNVCVPVPTYAKQCCMLPVSIRYTINVRVSLAWTKGNYHSSFILKSATTGAIYYSIIWFASLNHLCWFLSV